MKKKTFATVRQIGTRLRAGMKIKLGEDVYVVEMVNDCRARCRPVGTRHVEIKTRFGEDGKSIKFEAPLGVINISPNSDVEILP
jgi:hypothetical protein